MTLIASIQRRPEGFLTVSDVILSTERPGRRPEIDLPLRGQNSFRPFTADRDPWPIGMTQKTLLLRPNGMALWAGSYVIARAVLNDLATAYAQGQRPTLEDIIKSSGISQSEVDQISIIAFLDQGDAILQQVLNTEPSSARSDRSFTRALGPTRRYLMLTIERWPPTWPTFIAAT